MDDKLSLRKKLFEIQKACSFIKKDTEGHNYKYVDPMSAWSKIRSKMDELGVMLEPHLMDAPTIEISSEKIKSLKPVYENGKKTKDVEIEKIVDTRVFTQKCNMVWFDVDSNESISIPWVLTGEQDDISKAFGSASTYCRRYFVLDYFNIPTAENDPDSTSKSQDDSTYSSRKEYKGSSEKIRFGDLKGMPVSEVPREKVNELLSQKAWAKDKPNLKPYCDELDARYKSLMGK